MKNHWRDPNPHEKEIITEWTRTIERYEEPFLQVLTICFTILALFYVFYSRISGASSDDAATKSKYLSDCHLQYTFFLESF